MSHPAAPTPGDFERDRNADAQRRERGADPAPPGPRFAPEPLDSLDFLERAQAGDREALNALLARYQERIYRVARIRLGARLRRFLDSADIVNQANWIAVQNIGKLDPKDRGGIVHWLTKIVENQIHDAHDFYTAQKRDLRRDAPLALRTREGEEVERPLEGNEPTPSREVAAAEVQEIYDACVQELEPDHREVLLLRDYEGGEWGWVCQQLGRTDVHATQELHRRARIKLGLKLRQRLPQGRV